MRLDNDKGTQSGMMEIARSVADEYDEEKPLVDSAGVVSHSAVGDLADQLREYVEMFPEVEEIQSRASFVADLFGFVWESINWGEIAEQVLTDLDE